MNSYDKYKINHKKEFVVLKVLTIENYFKDSYIMIAIGINENR